MARVHVFYGLLLLVCASPSALAASSLGNDRQGPWEIRGPAVVDENTSSHYYVERIITAVPSCTGVDCFAEFGAEKTSKSSDQQFSVTWAGTFPHAHTLSQQGTGAKLNIGPVVGSVEGRDESGVLYATVIDASGKEIAKITRDLVFRNTGKTLVGFEFADEKGFPIKGPFYVSQNTLASAEKLAATFKVHAQWDIAKRSDVTSPRPTTSAYRTCSDFNTTIATALPGSNTTTTAGCVRNTMPTAASSVSAAYRRPPPP